MDSPIRQITVRIEAEADVPALRYGATRVEVFSDLVTPPNGLWISLSVTDSGRGLTADEVHRLFKRFAQADPSKDGACQSFRRNSLSGLQAWLALVSASLFRRRSSSCTAASSRSSLRRAAALASCVYPFQPRPELTIKTALLHPGAASDVPHRPAAAAGRALELHPQEAEPTIATNLSSYLSSYLRHRDDARGEHCRASSCATGFNVDSAYPRRGGAEFSGDVCVYRLSFRTQDNPINQAVLKRQLLIKKYAVTVANNGQEALDILFAASTPRIDCW